MAGFDRPNVIWIVVDSIRNYPCPEDPEGLGRLKIMDEIASEAIEFKNAVTSATSTVMSVSSMMMSIPAYYLSRNLEDFEYDKALTDTLAKILKAQGYSIYGIICSWVLRRKGWENILNPVPERIWPKGCKKLEHWPNELLDKIFLTLLKEGVRQPMFICFYYNGRRDPYINNRIEMLIERLRSEKILENSVLILCSDHGMPDPTRVEFHNRMKEKGFFFNRHDLIMTDDNILIPLILKYPECPSGRKIDIPVSSIDIVPTVLDILRIPYTTDGWGKEFRGKSLLPLIKGDDSEEFINRKIRTDTRYISQRDRIISIRGNGYKYVYFRDIPQEEREQFFDLKNDPFELTNIVNTTDPVYQRLIQEYREEYICQEKDAIEFQKEYLCKKFRKKIGKVVGSNSNFENPKILLFGSCHTAFLEILTDIFERTIKNASMDFIIEEENIPSEQEGKFPNLIKFSPGKFNLKTFLEKYDNLFEKKFDLLIIPLTDYILDIEQSRKIVEKMKNKQSYSIEMIQPPIPVHSHLARIIKEYTEIFSIARKIKAKNKIYVDYNMNLFKYPRLMLLKKFVDKMVLKRDIYMENPREIYKDFKRLIQRDVAILRSFLLCFLVIPLFYL